MKLQVLMATMHQKDFSNITASNLDAVSTIVVNQCNSEKTEHNGNSVMIYTQDRGLSKSRNLAIKNANADICLICDDDENFFDSMESDIIKAYETILDADIIIFDIANYHKSIKKTAHRLKKMELLKISSVQISFRLSSVKDKINFDENLGAGTINGFSEENKFLFTCLKNGLKIYYVPCDIGILRESESTWFKGYDEKYFFRRGKVTRYTLGLPLAFLYGLYFVVLKRKLYLGQLSLFKALKYLVKGVFCKDINKDLEI